MVHDHILTVCPSPPLSCLCLSLPSLTPIPKQREAVLKIEPQQMNFFMYPQIDPVHGILFRHCP
jgi:hypothetical protein